MFLLVYWLLSFWSVFHQKEAFAPLRRLRKGLVVADILLPPDSISITGSPTLSHPTNQDFQVALFYPDTYFSRDPSLPFFTFSRECKKWFLTPTRLQCRYSPFTSMITIKFFRLLHIGFSWRNTLPYTVSSYVYTLSVSDLRKTPTDHHFIQRYILLGSKDISIRKHI